jgi:hypothetical protein
LNLPTSTRATRCCTQAFWVDFGMLHLPAAPWQAPRFRSRSLPVRSASHETRRFPFALLHVPGAAFASAAKILDRIFHAPHPSRKVFMGFLDISKEPPYNPLNQ